MQLQSHLSLIVWQAQNVYLWCSLKLQLVQLNLLSFSLPDVENTDAWWCELDCLLVFTFTGLLFTPSSIRYCLSRSIVTHKCGRQQRRSSIVINIQLYSVFYCWVWGCNKVAPVKGLLIENIYVCIWEKQPQQVKNLNPTTSLCVRSQILRLITAHTCMNNLIINKVPELKKWVWANDFSTTIPLPQLCEGATSLISISQVAALSSKPFGAE